MSRVLICNMPFSNLRWPNLGPSLLKAALTRRGIACDMAYLNFDFAEQVGHDAYYWIADYFAFVLGGERLFAKHYFGARLPDDPSYYRDILLRADPEMTEQEFRQYQEVERCVGPFLDHCERSVDWGQYPLVGFATTFQQTMPSVCLAQRIKRRRPETVIVFGGAACEGEMGLELLAQFPEIDCVFLGEADLNFPPFAEQILAGGPVAVPPGAAGRRAEDGGERAEGRGRRTEGTGGPHPSSLTPPSSSLRPHPCAPDPLTVHDLDALPYPDFDDYFARHAASPLKDQVEALLFFETSRGCWWGQKHHCKFCGLNGASMVYRSKSPRRAVDELAYLARRHGARKACSSDNILDHRYFDTFLPMFRDAGLDLKYVFEMKCNMTRRQVETLLECGMGAAQLGIETFITPVLRMIDKGATGIQNLQTLKWLSEPGIEVKWNILYGFPGEDPEDYKGLADLVPSIYHLAPPIAFGRVRLDRFSPYFEDPGANGMANPRPNPAFHYTYPFPEDVLGRMAYYYEYDYADGRDPMDYFAPVREEIERWHALADTVTLRQWDRPDGVLILTDTRPGAAEFQRRLTGWEREAYLFCDAGKSLRKIGEHLESRPALAGRARCAPDEAALKRLLDQWVAERIMAFLDGRYLSLALRAPSGPGA